MNRILRTMIYYVRTAEKSFLWVLGITVVYAFYIYYVIMNGQMLTEGHFIIILQDSLFYIGTLMAFGVSWTEYYCCDAMALSFGGKRKDIYLGGVLMLILITGQVLILVLLLQMAGHGGISRETSLAGALLMLLSGSGARLLGYTMKKYGKIVYLICIMIFAGGGSVLMSIMSNGFAASLEIKVSSMILIIGAAVMILLQILQYLAIRKMAV